MAEQELGILVTLRDQATAQLRQINAELQDSSKNWQANFGAIKSQAQSAAIALGAMGAAITGALFLSYRASEEQRLEIARLTVALRNVGVSYDDVSGSLENYISATEKATGFSDSEQRNALSQLLMITGSYDRAMKLLPITFDLAAAKHIDVTTAAILLGRVAEGNINALNRYGFSMEGVKTAAQALDVIQGKVSGSAVAMRSPFKNLMDEINDLKERIGDMISKEMTKFVDKATEIIGKIDEWITAHPELAEQILKVGLALGIAALMMGFLTLMILAAVVALGILGGPFTLILLGITLLIAAIIYLILNWDWVTEQWQKNWWKIAMAVSIFFGPIGFAIVALIKFGEILIQHWDKTKGLWENIWNEMKVVALMAVNLIIKSINLMMSAIERAGKLIGKNWNWEIAPVLESDWGIYKSPPTVTPEAPIMPTIPGMPGMPSPTPFGNYGRLGETITININNAGSVITEQDLMAQIREQILLLQNRNVSSGIQ